jgi:hypothetical protein
MTLKELKRADAACLAAAVAAMKAAGWPGYGPVTEAIDAIGQAAAAAQWAEENKSSGGAS